jgi:zinc transport system permease protein
MLDFWHSLSAALEYGVEWFCDRMPPDTFFNHPFYLRGLLAIILVSLICGSVGALVVGNRMAFFSDALAHCAFAGVALGFLFALARGARSSADFAGMILPVMVAFGMLVGVGIAWVREKTSLSSDTVIGVFFAGAMGFGALLLKPLSRRSTFSPENFLFGDLMSVRAEHLVGLVLLGVLTAGMMAVLYNRLVFASFNPSLARSRRIPVRLCSYLFILLLALIVNLCLNVVGALLINAVLIVPAATAANLGRNMRQLFWYAIGLSLLSGLGGLWLSWEVRIPDPNQPNNPIDFGIGGSVVILSVVLFFLSVFFGTWRRRRTFTPATNPAVGPGEPAGLA